MGQKHQSATKIRTMSDTNQTTTQTPKLIGRIGRIPRKYFGGQAIENDPSMRQMQRDLLSFDDTIKHSCFSRRKSKQPKMSAYSEGYYSPDEQYYDQNQRLSLNDDDEYYHSSNNNGDSQQIKTKKYSWRCRYCATKNKSTAFECRRCREIETRF